MYLCLSAKKKKRPKRPLGRPRTRWKDSVVKDLRVLQKRAQLDVAYNREEWNKLVMAALNLNGPLSCM
ncbi:Reverse transcriptase domain-containing protein [Aphis craccivora]|uniref:Reverse transcriptase domain-containing protein n=1 Tax=Aphis craccivora TaxID=307492 RepID=A0A6G0YQU4_APHCR|nr:Reverse transcriptase domain-containing protein [Aphis craccivora]